MTEVYPRVPLQRMSQHPLFGQLWQACQELLDLERWPTLEDWQNLQARAEELPEAFRSLSFIADQKLGQRKRRKLAKQKTNPLRPGQRLYEEAIIEAKEIPTRPENGHDYFNALIWFLFPLGKLALHEKAYRSYRESDLPIQANLRNSLADCLTRLDEGSLLYFCEEGEAAESCYEIFANRELAPRDKQQFCRLSQLSVFGHGLLDVHCQGKRGLTVGVFVVPFSPGLSRDQAFATALRKSSLIQLGSLDFDLLLASFHTS